MLNSTVTNLELAIIDDHNKTIVEILESKKFIATLKNNMIKSLKG